MNGRDSVEQSVNTQLPNPGAQLRAKKRKWFLRNQRKDFTGHSAQRFDLLGCKIQQDCNPPTLSPGVATIIGGAQSKMKIYSPSCINYQEFQNDDSRTLNQAQNHSKCGAPCDCVGGTSMKLGLLRCFVLRGTSARTG